MVANVIDVDAALKALAEPRRRAILRLVWSQELPATAIADRFDDVTRSAVSQHLSVLRQAGLVQRLPGSQREGEDLPAKGIVDVLPARAARRPIRVFWI